MSPTAVCLHIETIFPETTHQSPSCIVLYSNRGVELSAWRSRQKRNANQTIQAYCQVSWWRHHLRECIAFKWILRSASFWFLCRVDGKRRRCVWCWSAEKQSSGRPWSCATASPLYSMHSESTWSMWEKKNKKKAFLTGGWFWSITRIGHIGAKKESFFSYFL